MNEYERLSLQAVRIKETYPPGTSIELTDMTDPFSPIPSGMRGTVKVVDDIGQIHMHWDNGRTLAVVPGEDSFRKLTEEEILAEQKNFTEEKILAEDCSISDVDMGVENKGMIMGM